MKRAPFSTQVEVEVANEARAMVRALDRLGQSMTLAEFTTQALRNEIARVKREFPDISTKGQPDMPLREGKRVQA